MVDHDHLQPEEHMHPELLQALQAAYRITPEEKQKEEQMLARVHERLERLAQGPFPQAATQESDRAPAPPFHVVSSTRSPRSARSGRVWFHRLNTLAAVLLAGVVVSSLVLTFASISRGRVASNDARSTAPVKNGIMLTEGHDLKMVTDQIGWVMDDYQTPSSIFHTTDGGKHWHNVTPPGYTFDGKHSGLSDLYVLDEKTAWLPLWGDPRLGLTNLLRTINGGLTWQHMTVPAYATDKMTFSDQNNGWLLGGSASLSSKPPLYHTSDGGKIWHMVGSVPAAFNSMQFLNDQVGWAIAISAFVVGTPGQSRSFYNTSGLYTTLDGGRTWIARWTAQSSQPFPPQGKETVPLPHDMLTAVNVSEWYLLVGSGSNSSVYQTLDAGQTWHAIGGPLPPNVDVRTMIDNSHTVGEMIVDPQRSAVGLATLTLTAGRWQATPRHLAGDLIDESFLSPQTGFVLIAASAHAPNLAPTALALYQTTDGGKTWQKLATLPIDS